MSHWESNPDRITYGRRGVDYFEDEEVETVKVTVNFPWGRWSNGYEFDSQTDADEFLNYWDIPVL